MPIAQGWGPGTWKITCSPLGARTEGWGGGRQWRMFTTALTDRLQGNSGGDQWKLFCPTPQPPPP